LLRLLAFVLVIAFDAGACAVNIGTARKTALPSQSAVAVVLRTRAPQSPDSCPMARTEGVLVRNTQSGVGFQDADGLVWEVIWPAEYTAREEVGGLVVLDGAGTVIAHEGDRVEIGGAAVGSATWLGCGGMRALEP